MSHVEPLGPDQIRDPELLELIERCEALGVPDALFPRILARVPPYAKAVLRALLLSHAGGNVDHRLKEIIRVQLAHTAGDPYFAGLRSRRARQAGLDEERIAAGATSFEDDPRFTPAEKWALRYAREMYLNPAGVDAAFYDEGKRYYSEAQIMELGAFIAFHYGMQVFARTLDIAQPVRTDSAARDPRS
jgi:alkylhydroperoxidase family enzyme